MAKLFFRASEDALDNITAAFDISHPLRVSFRYTRKVLNDLNSCSEHVDTKLCEETINSDGYIHGVNYKRAFFDTSYEEQEEKLAWFLLNNLFAIHEGWAERIYSEIFDKSGYKQRTFIQNLEYEDLSSKFNSYFTPRSKESSLLCQNFFSEYKVNSRLDFSKLDNYMLCYRYFKEARNCYMHKNFIASQNLMKCYNKFKPVATASDLDLDEMLVIIPPVLGSPVKLSIRGVIGFSQIIKRIIVVSDTYLLKNLAAEKEILSRKPNTWKCRTLSSKPNRAKEQITHFCNKAGLLRPTYTEELKLFLISNGIFAR
jgi:hypothetical protein